MSCCCRYCPLDSSATVPYCGRSIAVLSRPVARDIPPHRLLHYSLSKISSPHIMSEFGTFLNHKISQSLEKKETSGIDVVRTVNETIEALLAVRHMPPGTEVNIPERRILEICKVAGVIFMKQPMLLELQSPITIAGDIHGQYSDLLRLFELGGYPPRTNYLFLGDYVDRAKQSTEVILLLLCFKIKFARSFFLLRGNHECSLLNKIYGFFDECKRRYSVKVWRAFTNVFDCMPVAAIIEDQIFCSHGGISPAIERVGEILKLPRPCEIKETGVVCDLLWSDPCPDDDQIPGWSKSPRGVSFQFGTDIIDDFLAKNNLSLICRAHQVVEDGYEFLSNRKLVTIFSAPNYCGEFDNAGAMMMVNADMVCSFRIIRPESHKYKFPEHFPEYGLEDDSEYVKDSNDEIYEDLTSPAASTVNLSSREDSFSSIDSGSTGDDVVVPTDYDSLTASMPNLKLSYEDYIRIVESKNQKRFA